MQSWVKVLPVLVLLCALVVVGPPPSSATPVCTDPATRDVLCGGRVFPDPIESLTGLTYDETVAGLEALAAESEGWLVVSTIGTSYDGFPIVMAELTDPTSTVPLDDRKVVLVSQSIHGNEPGGREGGVRYVEDLLRGEDDARRALLDRVRLVQVFLNPDGWTAGDHDQVPDGDSVGLWARGNGNGALGVGDIGGVDLNRNAAWFGPIPTSRPDPLSEPESQALFDEVTARLAAGQDIQASVDIHGEVPDAAAVVMLSAGQFDLQGSMQQRNHGDALHASVDAELSDSSVFALQELVSGDIEPTILHASSEFGPVGVGGSGSGFQGDWLAQANGGDSSSLSTIELINLQGSPGVNSLTFRRDVFQIYRETVRGILGGLIDQAVIDWMPSVQLPGPTGFVRDPAVVIDPVRGIERTQMDFFDDLDAYLDQPLVSLSPTGLDANDLVGLDNVIVATDVLDAGAVAALRAWTDSGGNLVLTDSALAELPGLVDGVSAGDVTVDLSDINQIDFPQPRTDPLLDGIRDIAFLMTEPATIGYDTEGEDLTPAYRVATSTWTGLGGTSVGTIAGQTALGRVDVGSGRLTVIGQLLPPPVAHDRTLYGIESYGVLDTGYQILLNALGATLTVTPVDIDDNSLLVADVAVSIDAPTQVEVGDAVPVTVRLANDGPDTAAAITTTLTLPAALAPGTLPQACSADGRVVTCQRATLGDGADTTIEVPTTATANGAVTVSARIASASTDRVAANDTDSTVVRILAPGGGGGGGDGGGEPPVEGLTLDLSTSEATPAVGQTIVLTGTVGNDGATIIDEVTLDVSLPPGLVHVGGSADCTADDEVVTCPVDLPGSFAGLEVGATADVELAVVPTRVGDLDVGGTARGGDAVVPAVDVVSVAAISPDPTVVRLEGPERIATAVAASRDAYPDGTARAVVLARADAFPDALAGGPLAAAVQGPLLLTPTDTLPDAVAEEVERVLGDGGVVHLLGGANAVSPAVESAVGQLGVEVRRHGGNDRFETAVAIAREVGDPERVFVATGGDFPDALAAGAAAAHTDGVVVLTAGSALPAATRGYLEDVDGVPVTAVGGLAAQATPGTDQLVGDNRFETAALVAESVFDDPTSAGVATGAAFADALAGVAHIAGRQGPILLAERDRLPFATEQWLGAHTRSLERLYLYGGPAALGEGIETTLRAVFG